MTKEPLKKRTPRKVTPRYLENAAVYYLGRFASSSANFRRVMMRRVERSARFHGDDASEGARMVEDLIKRFMENGLLDDDAYAKGLAASLNRRGGSARAVRAKLRHKGLDNETIEAALAALSEEMEQPELAAAVALARRRRLGPFRPKAKRGEMRDKDLAALARAGFGYGMALKVIDAETSDELEEEIRCP